MKMKKLVCLIVVITMMVCLLAFAEADGASVTFNAEETESGYKVTLDTSGFSGIAMMQFNIDYDASKLSCKGASAGSAIAGNTGATINTNNAGEIIFVWDSLREIISDGSLIEISFDRIAEGAANVTIDTGKTVIFADSSFSEPQVSMTAITLGSDAAAEANQSESAPASEPEKNYSHEAPIIVPQTTPGPVNTVPPVAIPAATPAVSAPSSSQSAARAKAVNEPAEQAVPAPDSSAGQAVPAPEVSAELSPSAEKLSEQPDSQTGDELPSRHHDAIVIYLAIAALLACLVVMLIKRATRR